MARQPAFTRAAKHLSTGHSHGVVREWWGVKVRRLSAVGTGIYQYPAF
jgi:hypothetical protein